MEEKESLGFKKAARRRAERLKGKLEAILKDLREAPPQFPTGECLLPYEVEDFASTGKLPDERLKHVGSCEFCRGLLQISESVRMKFKQRPP
jgi:hypothetical protein